MSDQRFELVSKFKPAGDQPDAIKELVKGFEAGLGAQVLLGVTGSGKTFTMANVIQAVQQPTLIMAPNKTLAAQLYQEFKRFFPENAVEYFVSYYDYYQPEAYVAATDTYIEKEATINKDIEKERLIATLQDEMNHPELAETGLGNVDPDRFKQAIDLVVKANGLPRTPEPSEIFSDAFLPAAEDRIYKLL